MPTSDSYCNTNSRKKYSLKSTLAQVSVLYWYNRLKYIFNNIVSILQTLAVAAQNVISIELGMGLATPTIVIKDLYQNSSSSFSISQTEASWYGQ